MSGPLWSLWSSSAGGLGFLDSSHKDYDSKALGWFEGGHETILPLQFFSKIEDI